MTYLLIVFLGVLLLPLLAASWRVSLMGLAAQGVLIGWIAVRGAHAPTLATGLVVVDAIVLRAVLAPWILGRTLSSQNVPARNDVIPSNLFSWMLVAGIVFASFRLASALHGGARGSSLHVAVALVGLFLGFFVLSSQNGLVSQIVGLLRIENAIALLELDLHHHFVLPVQVALLFVYLLTVVLCARFLRAELAPEATTTAGSVDDEEPTL